MQAYMNWIKKKPKEEGPNLTNVQGAARTVGIALSVISAGLAIYDVATDEDVRNGRAGSYNAVKKYAAAALAVAGLVAMFCIPVVGQVLFIISLIWGLITAIGDYIGSCNKKWKDAYKNSYWFLYENDPEFKKYYDERDILVPEEKSSNLLLIEEKYADFKCSEAPSSDDETQEARNQRVYIALEKQGVLSSYYYTKPYKLDSFSIDKLLGLWKIKADYMAYKPTEEEAKEEESKPWWKKGLDLINPMTYIEWGLDTINSKEYELLDNYANIDKVVFNPDYVLLQKFVMWVTSNRLMEKGDNVDFIRTIGIRLEQSPFNFIPMVGIDMKDWSLELFDQALGADAFIVGQKEIAAMHNQLEALADGMKDVKKQQDEYVGKYKTYINRSEMDREALKKFLICYNHGSDGLVKDNWSECNYLAHRIHCEEDYREWNSDNKKTLKDFIERYKDYIERLLFLSPLSISQKAADLVLLHIKVKGYLDMGAIMNAYLKEKRDAYNDFDKEFTNDDLNKFLKKGTFLNVEGDTFLDWLSGLYSAYDEMDKSLNQLEKDVDKYNEQADLTASGERGWLIHWNVDTPQDLIPDINEELNSWKTLIDEWQQNIADDNDLNVVLGKSENQEFADNILNPFDEINEFLPLEALDVENESVASQTIPLSEELIEANVDLDD